MGRFSLKYFLSIAALIIFLVASGCVPKEELIKTGSEITLDKTTFSFSQKDVPHAYDLFPEYRIAPGDVLDIVFQIRTWEKKEEFLIAVDHVIKIVFVHAPELNQEQRVRPDGRITLPYLGSVYVIEKTVEELTQELKERYSNILQNPDLYVVVPEFRSAIKELKADLHTAPRGLSKLIRVRPDGYATVPMIGNVFVGYRTFPEVNKYLNEEYEKIMKGLHCDLFLHEHAGSVVYVMGEVKNPGAYGLVKPVTILEAITLAGSFIRGAQINNVIIVRKYEKKFIATRVDVESILALKNLHKNRLFYLEPDDIVYVPKRPITKAAEVSNDIADILMFRGWNIGLSWAIRDDPIIP